MWVWGSVSWCEGSCRHRVQTVLLVVILSVCLIVSGAEARAEACKFAQSNCMQQLGCGMALHNYMIKCGELIHGQVSRCSNDCKKAIISLLSTQDQEGKNLMTCDCQGNQFCRMQKQRLEVCSNDVIAAMATINDPSTTISCSLAELICSADTACLTALTYYQRHCSKMIKGEKCTSRCNNSLTILHRQAKARKLRTCECEGSEEYDCNAVHHNMHTLCFRRRHRHSPHTSTTAPPSNHHTLNQLVPASHACPVNSPSQTFVYCTVLITLLTVLNMLTTSILPAR